MDPAAPGRPSARGLTLRPLREEDVADLQALVESDPGYAERVTGGPPGPSEALSLLLMRPEDASEEDKVVLGGHLGEDGPMVAAIDLVRGYPSPGMVFIGLLLVERSHQGRGLGSIVVKAATEWVRATWPEGSRWRLAVVDTNAAVAAPFWRRVGFEPTGEERPYRYDNLESVVRLYEAPITDLPE